METHKASVSENTYPIPLSIVTFNSYYIRDPQGKELAMYKSYTVDGMDIYGPQLEQLNIYGTDHIGYRFIDQDARDLYPVVGRTLQHTNYFIKNHLGNNLRVISDRKISVYHNSILDHTEAEEIVSSDYYAFGTQMRSVSAPYGIHWNQRYGFNGKEISHSTNDQTNYDYGFRIYNAGIGRFLSVDPLTAKYPSQTPYLFAGNNPIYYKDIKGMYKVPADKLAEYRNTYPMIMKYLETQIENDISNSTKIINGYKTVNPNLSTQTIVNNSKWDHGHIITFVEEPGQWPRAAKTVGGFHPRETNSIQLNSGYALAVEHTLASDATDAEKQVAFTRFYMTLLHESAHVFDQWGTSTKGRDGITDLYKMKQYYAGEIGDKFDEIVYGNENYRPYTDPAIDIKDPILGITSEKYQPGTTEGIIKEAQKTEEGKKTLPTVPRK
ncbi:MAG: RHS repeat-associated core domain-containing protein [Saprospiraceae bacterium]